MTALLFALLACSSDDQASETLDDEVMERAKAARSERTQRKTSPTTKRRKDRWARLASAVRALEGGAVSEEVDALLDEREARREGDALRVERARSGVERAFVQACQGEAVDRAFLDFQAEQARVLQQDRSDLESILELSGEQGRDLIWSIAHPERTFAAGRREFVGEGIVELDTDSHPGLARLQLELEVSLLDATELVDDFEATVLAQDPSKQRSIRNALEALRVLDEGQLVEQGERYLLLQSACLELEPSTWLGLVAGGQVGEALMVFPVPASETEAPGKTGVDADAPSIARMKRGPGRQDKRPD